MNTHTLPPVTFTHWGLFHPQVDADRLVGLRPFAADPHPTAFGQSLIDAVHSPLRITQPMVRAGWLDKGPAPGTTRPSPATWTACASTATRTC